MLACDPSYEIALLKEFSGHSDTSRAQTRPIGSSYRHRSLTGSRKTVDRVVTDRCRSGGGARGIIVGLVIYNKRSTAADLAFGEAMDIYNAPLAQPGQPPRRGQNIFLPWPNGPSRPTSSSWISQIAMDLWQPGKGRVTLPALLHRHGPERDMPRTLEEVADGHDAAWRSLAKLALANLYQQTDRN